MFYYPKLNSMWLAPALAVVLLGATTHVKALASTKSCCSTNACASCNPDFNIPQCNTKTKCGRCTKNGKHGRWCLSDNEKNNERTPTPEGSSQSSARFSFVFPDVLDIIKTLTAVGALVFTIFVFRQWWCKSCTCDLCDEPPPDPDEEEKILYCGLIRSLHDELSAAGTLHPDHQKITQRAATRQTLQRLIGQRNDLLNIRSRQKKCLEHFDGTQQQTILTFGTVEDMLQRILGNFEDKWQRRARQFSTTTKFAREISKIKNLKPLILSSHGQSKKQIIYEHTKFQTIKLNAIETVLPEFYIKLQHEYASMRKKIEEKSFESKYHLSRDQNFERINKLRDKAEASFKKLPSTVKTRPAFSWEKEMNDMKLLLNERQLLLGQCSRDSREKIFDAYDVVRKQYPTNKTNVVQWSKDIKQLQTSMEDELEEIEKHLGTLDELEQRIKHDVDRYEQWVTDQLNSREREALLILRDETRKVEQWAEKVNAVHRHQLDTMASLQTERHFLRKMSTDILNIKLDIKLEKAWLAYDFLFSTLQHLRKKTRNLLLNRADKEKDIDSWIERFNNDDMERLKLLAEWTAARTAECNSLLRELPSLHDCNSAPTLERFMSHFAHFVAENNVGGATTAPIRKSLAHRAVRKVGKWLGVKKSKKKRSSGIPDAAPTCEASCMHSRGYGGGTCITYNSNNTQSDSDSPRSSGASFEQGLDAV